MRVLMVCDYADWILGELAFQLQRCLRPRIDVTVLVEADGDFRHRLACEQRSHEVVHILSPWNFYQLAAQLQRPAVATLHHMVDWSVWDPHAWRIDALCIVSEQWRAPATQHVPSSVPIRRMGYGVAVDLFQPSAAGRQQFRQQAGLRDDTLVLGFAGKVSSNEGSRKGLDRLWHCLHRLRQSHLPFVLRIAGRGWSRDMLPRELVEHVQLLPFTPRREDLARFYASLDYYLCTSRVEGVPHPVLEAMCAGVVTLSTPVGVVPEIVRHGENGFLLREGRIESDFVAALESTARDAARRQAIGAAARDTVVSEFNWSTAVQPRQFLDIYHLAQRHYAARPGAMRRQHFWQLHVQPWLQRGRSAMARLADS